MATTAFKSTPVSTVGELPAVGTAAPAFELTGSDLSPVTLESLSGRTVILNVFPSLDTGVCAASVRKFNELATGLADTTVVAVSADLPFAAGRFCSAEGIENVVTGSVFRSTFGQDYGLTQAEGPMAGLMARAVLVIDPQGTVTYTEVVPEITTEPDYDAALAAARA
jgi:thioredoxin-dependent peroxiredoxin